MKPLSLNFRLNAMMLIVLMAFANVAFGQFQTEGFEGFAVGNKVAQSAQTAGLTYWNTYNYNPGSSEDGIVSSIARTGNKSMKIAPGGDCVIIPDEGVPLTTGIWVVDLYMYVPAGKSGYFNVQNVWDNEWGVQVYINAPYYDGDPDPYTLITYGDDGSGYYREASFNPIYNAWMHWQIEINLDTDVAKAILDGTSLATWQWSEVGSKSIDIVDFWAPDDNAEAYFDDIKLKGYPPLVRAGSDQTICASQSSASLVGKIVGEVSSIEWSTSSLTNPGIFSDASIYKPTYTPSATEKAAGHVHLTLTANRIDGGTVSDELTLSFDPVSNGGNVSGGAIVCYGTNSTELTLYGQTGNVVRWQYTADGGNNWYNIVNTGTTNTATDLITTTSYRAVVQSGVCSAAPGGYGTITVRPAMTAGTIGSAQAICYGISPAMLTSTAGSGSGTVSYEWQTNSTGSYVTIGGATDETYQPPTLTATTSYQRRTVSYNSITCYSAYTTPVTITVYPQFTSGSIKKSGETICYNGNPSQIGDSIPASGGNGTIYYQWQSSTDVGFTSPTTISSNASTYTPPANFTATTWYRRQAKDETCNISWNTSAQVWKVTVKSLPIISGNNNVTQGAVVTYSTPYRSGNSYTWNASHGNPQICFPNRNCLTLTWDFPCGIINPGYVTVTETDPVFGCIDTVTKWITIAP